MTSAFVHDAPAQRVVFAPGALARIAAEVEHLGLHRVLVIATPGSGARLGERVVHLLGSHAAGLHAQAVIHVPRAVADAGLAAAKAADADGLVAVGGGSAIGLAKIVARDTGLPILAVPTTYSGSEVTTIWGLSDGDRKMTGRAAQVLPRTILYDPDLTFDLPPAVTAASAMNALAHCVEALWVPECTPMMAAAAMESIHRFGGFLGRAVADGGDAEARAQCLIAAWLAGTALLAGGGLQHKLAHILGGYGLPHAETHAILLPHVTRFNLAEAPTARARLCSALTTDDPAAALAALLRSFPIAQRLRDVGFSQDKFDDAAAQVGALKLAHPRPVSAAEARGVIVAAY